MGGLQDQVSISFVMDKVREETNRCCRGDTLCLVQPSLYRKAPANIPLIIGCQAQRCNLVMWTRGRANLEAHMKSGTCNPAISCKTKRIKTHYRPVLYETS